MSKKQIVLIIILCIVSSWIFEVFAGRILVAKISTWPMLNRLKILSPQAPIVITNRETFRISDSGDAPQAAVQVKSKISLVILAQAGSVSAEGTAVNVTSDGVFVTAASVFGKSLKDVYVLLNDGRSAPVESFVVDPATKLAFFKAKLDKVPTANLGASLDLKPGEKILFAAGSMQNYFVKTVSAAVNFSQADIAGQEFESDMPSRSFGAGVLETLVKGQAVANGGGEVVGIWNGSAIVSSDVLKQAINLYLQNPQKLARPSFGFSYTVVSDNESRLGGTQQGLLVKSVAAGGQAKTAGLAVGDIITDFDGQKISEMQQPEEIFQKYKPGDKIKLSVVRGKQVVSLNLTAAELK